MKKHKKLTKKQYWFLMLTSIILMIFAFGFLVVGAIYQEKGQDINPVIILVGFFGCMIIALAILFINLKSAINYEYEAKIKKIEKQGYTEINNIWPNKIIEKLYEKKFEFTDRGYFHKRKFTFWKDFVNYYIKICDCKDIHETIKKEKQAFSLPIPKGNFVSFVLCLVKDFVDQEDLKTLVNFNKTLLASENVMLHTQRYRGSNMTIVLLDRYNNTLYYVSGGKNSLTLYSYGTRLIEEITKE